MRHQRVAVVGGGITAGLAAYLLSKQLEVSLIGPIISDNRGIPEIIPRQVFFNILGIEEEEKFIENIVPDITHWAWKNEKDPCAHKREFKSNEHYLVYDKSRLAQYLCNTAPIAHRFIKEISNISELHGYSRVFDCRGAQIVQKDPSYQVLQASPARTVCRYMVISTSGTPHEPCAYFWSCPSDSGKLRTFFKVRIGIECISFGCSCSPNDLISQNMLFEMLEQFSIASPSQKILFEGVAVPNITIHKCQIPHVIPLGDARSLPCPLTEYGVLKALSEIINLTHIKGFENILFQRPFIREIDPHLPYELLL